MFNFNLFMPIKISIVEDLDEVREGLAELIRSDKELSMTGSFPDAESAESAYPEMEHESAPMGPSVSSS